MLIRTVKKHYDKRRNIKNFICFFSPYQKGKKTSRKTKTGVIKNQQPRHVLGGKNGQQRE